MRLQPPRSEPARTSGPEGTIAEKLARYAVGAAGAFAPNTLRAIRSDTRLFAEWCEAEGLAAGLPAAPETVSAFIDAMADRRKPATVGRYVSSLDHMHRAADLPPPGASNAVRLALRRMRRAKSVRQKQATGLRWETLAKVLAGMGDSPLDLRDAALLCLAYDTFARSAELATLDVRDVAQDADGATAFFRRSKTDQEGEGEFRFVARSTYARVAAWVKASGRAPGAPLFAPIGPAARNDRLSPADIYQIVRRRCGGRYSAHSTRVGAALDAKAAGATTGAIQQAGGWKSDRMVARYTERLATRESAAAMLAEKQGR